MLSCLLTCFFERRGQAPIEPLAKFLDAQNKPSTSRILTDAAIILEATAPVKWSLFLETTSNTRRYSFLSIFPVVWDFIQSFKFRYNDNDESLAFCRRVGYSAMNGNI